MSFVDDTMKQRGNTRAFQYFCNHLNFLNKKFKVSCALDLLSIGSVLKKKFKIILITVIFHYQYF